MITHYDMMSGEIIAEEPDKRVSAPEHMPTELRLMTVDEAIAVERHQRRSGDIRMPPPSWTLLLD